MKCYKETNFRVPVKSWCNELDDLATGQVSNLAKHPTVYHHVALMPDAHGGKGMPIGGVIACDNAVLPYAVGVDIGCGLAAVQTSIGTGGITPTQVESILGLVREGVPMGLGKVHTGTIGTLVKSIVNKMLEKTILLEDWPKYGWCTEEVRERAVRSIGTLGSGNHFIELQRGEDGFVWLMLHSGSRSLGYKIAKYYFDVALSLNKKWHSQLPDDALAFLPADSGWGQAYIRSLMCAQEYAAYNRKLMMGIFKEAIKEHFPAVKFLADINIHHNYAAQEKHFGKMVWVHRKGATSARDEELGIIPGSMGTASYIVKGLGNRESFMSCSHGAGRKMSRTKATSDLSIEDCNKAMEGIIFDGWTQVKRGRNKGKLDLGEAPSAYKDIEDVMEAQSDLVMPLVKLYPLGVLKG
jgi:tRNA-splicing ligase RtcB